MLKLQCLSCKLWLKAEKRILRLANTHSLKNTNQKYKCNYLCVAWIQSCYMAFRLLPRALANQEMPDFWSPCKFLHSPLVFSTFLSFGQRCLLPGQALLSQDTFDSLTIECMCCLPLPFCSLTSQRSFALRILEWKTLCLSKNCCAIQQLYYRKSLQPDSVTLPSVGSAGLRGS